MPKRLRTTGLGDTTQPIPTGVMVIVVEGTRALHAISGLIFLDGKPLAKNGEGSPKKMVQYDLLKYQPWVLPKENQMSITLKKARYQVNQKFNKNEKKKNLQYSG